VPPGKPSPKLAITIAADVHEQVLAAAARRGVCSSKESVMKKAPGLSRRRFFGATAATVATGALGLQFFTDRSKP
jgi:hypothetical protein